MVCCASAQVPSLHMVVALVCVRSCCNLVLGCLAAQHRSPACHEWQQGNGACTPVSQVRRCANLDEMADKRIELAG